ncbi:MAG: glycosyltransferase, partial [Chitinophagales bacterium]
MEPGILFILFCALCLAATFQLFYHFYFFIRFVLYKEKNAENTSQPPVSVIICARNEDTNLKKNLPHILAQEYPLFEVIVVDDNSDDGTLEYLHYLSHKEPRLKRVRV